MNNAYNASTWQLCTVYCPKQIPTTIKPHVGHVNSPKSVQVLDVYLNRLSLSKQTIQFTLSHNFSIPIFEHNSYSVIHI